ncbi:MAG: hypothetical protein ABIR37_00605 [Candidatus Saccharimonadales bacterium]
MLEKLLATLPYNSGSREHLVFYGKRLHGEKSIRRLGMVFILLTFFVQFFAFIAPPQPTMARSNNDLIDGGISSRSDAVNYCNNDIANYKDILANYGITCADVAKTVTVSLKSTDQNKQLFSMGRLPYGKQGETPVSISGKTYYLRYLWSWDTGPYSTYKALKGVSSVTGKTFYILYNCGNLTFIGLPAAPPKCTWDSSIYANNPACQPPKCALDRSLPADSPKCKACAYDSSILKSNIRCVQCPYPGLGSVTKDNAKCVPPCPYNSAISKDNASCKPCSASQTRDDKTACLELTKSASNTTAGLADANGTTAAAGDTIVYTLSVKNTGKALVPKFVVQENMNDVLDYADITDTHGGTLDANKIMSWPAADIKAGETLQQHITIKIKTTLPATPTSTSDPGHYDSAMTNVYGNTVNIYLPKTVVQTTEQITTQLPNTGPGTALGVSFAITMVAAYFFARTRLLSKETELALNDATTGGTV